MNTTDIKTFNYLENGNISFSVLDTIKCSNTLEAGSYTVEWVVEYPKGHLELNVLDLGEIYKPIPFHFIEKLDLAFEKFFEPSIKTKINSLGYAHKLGLLLYGKQGGSKSSIWNYYADNFIKEQNAIYFYVKGSYISECWSFIKQVRKIQDNPIVICLDECDKFFGQPDQENTIKPMLDGNLEIDNCLVLMTTNYVEKIPKTLIERPSRIKYKFEVESIENIVAINGILTNALSDIMSKEDLQEASNENKGKTIDEIKEFIQDTIMDLKFEKSTKKSIGFKK